MKVELNLQANHNKQIISGSRRWSVLAVQGPPGPRPPRPPGPNPD